MDIYLPFWMYRKNNAPEKSRKIIPQRSCFQYIISTFIFKFLKQPLNSEPKVALILPGNRLKNDTEAKPGDDSGNSGNSGIYKGAETLNTDVKYKDRGSSLAPSEVDSFMTPSENMPSKEERMRSKAESATAS